jgi:hypothetical protein
MAAMHQSSHCLRDVSRRAISISWLHRLRRKKLVTPEMNRRLRFI